jgi:hypothetical protein
MPRKNSGLDFGFLVSHLAFRRIELQLLLTSVLETLETARNHNTWTKEYRCQGFYYERYTHSSGFGIRKLLMVPSCTYAILGTIYHNLEINNVQRNVDRSLDRQTRQPTFQRTLQPKPPCSLLYANFLLRLVFKPENWGNTNLSQQTELFITVDLRPSSLPQLYE